MSDLSKDDLLVIAALVGAESQISVPLSIVDNIVRIRAWVAAQLKPEGPATEIK